MFGSQVRINDECALSIVNSERRAADQLDLHVSFPGTRSVFRLFSCFGNGCYLNCPHADDVRGHT